MARFEIAIYMLCCRVVLIEKEKSRTQDFGSEKLNKGLNVTKCNMAKLNLLLAPNLKRFVHYMASNTFGVYIASEYVHFHNASIIRFS